VEGGEESSPRGGAPQGGGAGGCTALSIGIPISILFLYLTLRRVELAEVWTAMKSVSLPVLSLALVTRGLAFPAMALRSKATLAPGGSAGLKVLTLSHLLGYTGNNIFPFRLGELLRIDYLARRANLSRTFLAGTVAVERLMDSAVLLTIFALTVPAVLGENLWEGAFPMLAGATLLAMALGLAAVLWKGFPGAVGRVVRPLSQKVALALEELLRKLVTGLSSLAHAQWAPAALGATILYWILGAGSILVVITAFGLELPWFAPFLVLSVTSFGTALPSSPSFVGTYHYFSALGLSLLGVDATTAASFALVTHAMAFVPYTLLGLAVFARSWRVWIRRGQSS
jgi:uncharacterized protein (TIRG00374 family)